MTTRDLDSIRQGVLARMERGEKMLKFGIIAAAVAESGLMAFALIYMDWKDKVQVELFIFSILGYTIIVLGMVALAGHVTRAVGRILEALETHR